MLGFFGAVLCYFGSERKARGSSCLTRAKGARPRRFAAALLGTVAPPPSSREDHRRVASRRKAETERRWERRRRETEELRPVAAVAPLTATVPPSPSVGVLPGESSGAEQTRERDLRLSWESNHRAQPPFASTALPPSELPPSGKGVTAGEGSCVSVTLTAGSGSVTSGTTDEASGCFCRRRKTLPSPLPEPGSPLPLEVAAGLPPNRFGDRRCFGSAVPSSFESLWWLRKRFGAEVLIAVDSGGYERSQLASLGCDFNVLSSVQGPDWKTGAVVTPKILSETFWWFTHAYSFSMKTWRQFIGLCIYLLVWSSFISSPIVDSANSNFNSGNERTFHPVKKFVMQSYFDRHIELHDSVFDNFISQEDNVGLCQVLPENHDFVPRLSVLKRDLIGEGSHRHVSTLLKFQSQQLESSSQLLSSSCDFIIIERLPTGVFADPFELQRLVQRGVFNDVDVFGDTNLELPSFLSNRSAVEIHLVVDPNKFLEPTDIKIELPLHARYQPLNESGYSTVELGMPDILVRCSTKERSENQNYFFKLTNNDADVMYEADVLWRIPSGKKAHSNLVFVITFSIALLSTLVIFLSSLEYSKSRVRKDSKQS
ncbi:hypothetical protein Ahy_B10g101019 isoform G [Arachis hypogaea]|uniref:Phosphatidylinositol-glycan biosynthesis class X protein n=2 Tax=Arachis TaxID=3817 RepID=A0A444WYA3_ARAHY|nr:hypothetical protein Ahy_B10g101019 isoform G [Arachis hypogaea]